MVTIKFTNGSTLTLSKVYFDEWENYFINQGIDEVIVH